MTETGNQCNDQVLLTVGRVADLRRETKRPFCFIKEV